MPGRNNLDWKSYEAVQIIIYKTLGNKSGVKIESHGNSCKISGKSGVDHQIDILASLSYGIHSYRTVSERK